MSLSFTDTACIMLFQRFSSFETKNLYFAVYFMIDKHSYEQVHLKVEPKSFLYEFVNSGDPLYLLVTHPHICLLLQVLFPGGVD